MFKLYFFNIILSFTARSSKWFSPFRLLTEIVCAFIISTMRTTCPIHYILLELIIVIIFGEGTL
jgi:hypothetical protein